MKSEFDKTAKPAAESTTAQPTPANPFEVSRQNIWQQYHVYLSGSSVGAFLIVSSNPLTERAASALLNTSAALAYGRVNTAFFTLSADESEQLSAVPPLDEAALFRVIESLDPLCVVITDLSAAQQIAQAYRIRLSLEAPTALLGHACVCFTDFDALLEAEASKQKAWSLLKTLPVRS